MISKKVQQFFLTLLFLTSVELCKPKRDVRFFIHRPLLTEIIEINSTHAKLHLDPSKPTKILIHGWKSSTEEQWVRKMAQNYHMVGDYNIVSIDWYQKADQSYSTSASHLQNVGNQLATFIIESTAPNPSAAFLRDLHLVGHSMGAHVAGFAGKKMTRILGRIGRITGLDAAAVLFETPFKKPVHQRLDSSDADFVDLIHTNAGRVGVAQSYGAVDFYPNDGGPIQPQCEDPSKEDPNGCSHMIVLDYFSESIVAKEKFEAVECANASFYHDGLCDGNQRAVMGEHVPRGLRGNFYLDL